VGENQLREETLVPFKTAVCLLLRTHWPQICHGLLEDCFSIRRETAVTMRDTLFTPCQSRVAWEKRPLIPSRQPCERHHREAQPIRFLSSNTPMGLNFVSVGFDSSSSCSSPLRLSLIRPIADAFYVHRTPYIQRP
jgi:hypothetical protein